MDVSQTAREAGLRFPVAVTRRVWDEIVTPDPRARKWGQSEEGRLWDVLYMLRLAARNSSGDTLHYRLSVVLNEKQQRTVTLKAVCGPGDQAKPVITVMLPDED